ncbi:MAG TPA: hypothetical protein VFN26_19500 [Candidatus Acidoferrum sp.]|nr:hypothetical protein [Candidatus Acidoferrum sp.]
MSRPKSSRSRVAANDASLCRFTFADGRICRMFRQPDHPSLCIFHARAERQLWESDRLGDELAASLTGDFMTATDINFVLGKLFKAIAQNRIPPRVAANLAFVGKLLLQSLDKLKNEYRFKYEYEAWKAMQRDAIHLSDPPAPIPPGEKPLPASGQAFAAEVFSRVPTPEVAPNS